LGNKPDNKIAEKIQLLMAILADKDAPKSAGQVAGFLLERYNSGRGYAWPGAKTIARAMQISQRTAQYGLMFLREANYFSAKGLEGGKSSARYYPNFEKGTELFGDINKRAADRGAQILSLRGANPDAGGASSFVDPRKSLHPIPTTTPPKDSIPLSKEDNGHTSCVADEEFDRFFNKHLVIRNIDKGSARAEYGKWREKGVTAEKMFDRTMRFLFLSLPKAKDAARDTTS
jgi:hypothetical protein